MADMSRPATSPDAEILVLVKPSDGKVTKATLEALTIARGLGKPSAVVVGAPGLAASLVDKLGEYGAVKVYAAEADELKDYLVTPKVAVLEKLVRQVSPGAVLIPSNQEGKEIAGRLAVRLDNGVLTDVVSLDADGTATQVAFAGSTMVKSKVSRLPPRSPRPSSRSP
jgi:electron transfer flavoprotein alpha subunit